MCACALIVLMWVHGGYVSIQEYFTQPAECRIYSIQPNIAEHRLVFRRSVLHQWQTVEIPVPPKEQEGHWHINYCWGERKASVGHAMQPVILSPIQGQMNG